MSKTKYEKLYGKPVGFFPNEEENVRMKLRLASSRLSSIYALNEPYSYERSVEEHELIQAIAWATKILEDIGN